MDERYKLDTIAIKARYWNINTNLFSGTDTEETFKKNLLIMPIDWKYRTKTINYNVNSLGYRTKEFNQINQNNFFIAYGCSFTFGVGLAEDELWTTTVSNKLGIDCLNLGMGGAGMDYIYLNTLTYLKNTTVRPKFVIIQCPQPARMVMRSLDNFEMSGPNFPGTKDVIDMYNQAVKDKSYLYTSFLAWHNTMTFWQTAGVPVYCWTFQHGLSHDWQEIISDFEFKFHLVTPEENILKNRARDLMHYPASYQIRTGKAIADYIKNDPKFNIVW